MLLNSNTQSSNQSQEVLTHSRVKKQLQKWIWGGFLKEPKKSPGPTGREGSVLSPKPLPEQQDQSSPGSSRTKVPSGACWAQIPWEAAGRGGKVIRKSRDTKALVLAQKKPQSFYGEGKKPSNKLKCNIVSQPGRRKIKNASQY